MNMHLNDKHSNDYADLNVVTNDISTSLLLYIYLNLFIILFHLMHVIKPTSLYIAA